jgi:hypothetical protein
MAKKAIMKSPRGVLVAMLIIAVGITGFFVWLVLLVRAGGP